MKWKSMESMPINTEMLILTKDNNIYKAFTTDKNDGWLQNIVYYRGDICESDNFDCYRCEHEWCYETPEYWCDIPIFTQETPSRDSK